MKFGVLKSEVLLYNRGADFANNKSELSSSQTQLTKKWKIQDENIQPQSWNLF